MRFAFCLILLLLLLVGLAPAGSQVEAAPAEDSTPRVEITSLTISKAVVQPGESFLVKATIANRGDQPAHDVSLAIATTAREMEVVATTPEEPISLLDTGEERILEAELVPGEAGRFEVRVGIVTDARFLGLSEQRVEVEVISGTPAGRSPFTASRIVLAAAGLALVILLSLAILTTAGRNKARKAIKGLVTETRIFAPSRSETAPTLAIFLALVFILLIPYAFPPNPSPKVALWLMRTYFPLRAIVPLGLVAWHGLRVHKRGLAFLVAFCPHLILTLAELLWRPFSPVVLRENLYFGFALGLLGLGGAMYSHRTWLGVFIAVLALTLYFGGGVSEGIMRYIQFLLSQS